MNRQRRFLAAAVALFGVALLLPSASRPAEAHGFFRFGFGYPEIYRPVFYPPPPPPVFYDPPVVYSYYRPAYWGWYRRTVFRPVYHRRVAFRHVVHRHWCSCRCCR